jgi:hypothetical protein
MDPLSEIMFIFVKNIFGKIMENKVCKKCGIKKPLSEFHKKLDSYRNSCKECRKEETKKYRENNSEVIKEKKRIYYNLNKDEINEVRRTSDLYKIRIQKYNKKSSEKRKIYYKENYERLSILKKDWREKNKEQLKQKRKEYYIKNKVKRREKNLMYVKKRFKEDFIFKLKARLRCRIYNYLKRKGYRKNCSSMSLIGIDKDGLRNHIENKFKEGMTWDNYGFYGWHIDHIIPLCSAKSEEELYKLFHYTNLQPLWWNENLSKSSKIL